MVDKIDRPDPVSKYEIQKSHETHDEGQQHQRRRGNEDEEKSDFSSPDLENSWNKFRESSPQRQVITLQRDNVRQAIFRQAALKHRSAVLEMDLILKDGRSLSRAAYVSNNMDDYWKWKGWVPGQLIPIELMIQNQVMQVSIPQPGATVTQSTESTDRARTSSPDPSMLWPWQDRKTGQLNWVWVSKVAAGAIAALWVIGKWARWW